MRRCVTTPGQSRKSADGGVTGSTSPASETRAPGRRHGAAEPAALSAAMDRAMEPWPSRGLRTRAELSVSGVSLVTIRALERRGLVVRVWARAPLVVWRRRT